MFHQLLLEPYPQSGDYRRITIDRWTVGATAGRTVATDVQIRVRAKHLWRTSPTEATILGRTVCGGRGRRYARLDEGTDRRMHDAVARAVDRQLHLQARFLDQINDIAVAHAGNVDRVDGNDPIANLQLTAPFRRAARYEITDRGAQKLPGGRDDHEPEALVLLARH